MEQSLEAGLITAEGGGTLGKSAYLHIIACAYPHTVEFSSASMVGTTCYHGNGTSNYLSVRQIRCFLMTSYIITLTEDNAMEVLNCIKKAKYCLLVWICCSMPCTTKTTFKHLHMGTSGSHKKKKKGRYSLIL